MATDIDRNRFADKLPRAFWIESVLALISAALTLLTIVAHQWLEALGFDPDHGDGTAEWFIVAAFAVSAVANGTLARMTWRRARPA